MDFVVDVLQQFFSMDLDKATQVMLHVHTAAAASAGCSPAKWPRPRLPRSTSTRG
jgi:ATP-dependent Clp protease adapter protein ClpS